MEEHLCLSLFIWQRKSVAIVLILSKINAASTSSSPHTLTESKRDSQLWIGYHRSGVLRRYVRLVSLRLANEFGGNGIKQCNWLVGKRQYDAFG